MPCTIYIDESGDTGITKLRSSAEGGSSPYFVMGAVAMQPATEIQAKKLLDQLQSEFKKPKRWKHATDLNHSQRTYFCRELSKLHVRCFGLISHKPTLEEYAKEIEWDPHSFYNKCAKYLLEIVGRYLGAKSSELWNPSIVFEKRNHDYDRMIRYISKVKENPIYPPSKNLKCINPFGIVSRTKDEDDLLRIADMVSYSVYSCVNKTPDNFNIAEPRYLKELSSRFAVGNDGKILANGLKCIHDVRQLGLDPEITKFLYQLRGKPSR